MPLLALPRRHLPAHVGDARRHRRHRGEPERRSPAARWRRCARRERPVPLDFEYRETPLHETHRGAGRAATRARLPGQLHPARRRRAGAEPDERRRLAPRRRRRPSREALAGVALRHALRQGAAALPAPRHRPAPRRAAAEVPAAGRAAGAAGAAQGDQRHRHARRGRQHPHPHRALHPALQVRRREDRHPGACATSSRSPGAPGARASTSAASVVAQAPEHVIENLRLAEKKAAGQEGGDAEAAAEGLRPLGPAAPSSGCRTRPPEPLRVALRASRHGHARSTCCRARRPARRRLRAAGASSSRARHGDRRAASAQLRRRAAQLLPHAARAPGCVDARAATSGYRGATSRSAPELQRDFSLHHTLSLYLVETLADARPRRARATRSTCCRWSSRSWRTRERGAVRRSSTG